MGKDKMSSATRFIRTLFMGIEQQGKEPTPV